MKHSIMVATALLLTFLSLWMRQAIWGNMSEEQQNQSSVQFKALIAGMSTEEFELMSAIVEAESNRTDSTEGKTLIALTIFNRVESSKFPDSIRGVISQSGQFQVYEEGTYKWVGRTDSSDRAVIEASFWKEGEHPAVMYFNCIGFSSWAEPYAYVEGNYFSLGE